MTHLVLYASILSIAACYFISDNRKRLKVVGVLAVITMGAFAAAFWLVYAKQSFDIDFGSLPFTSDQLERFSPLVADAMAMTLADGSNAAR